MDGRKLKWDMQFRTAGKRGCPTDVGDGEWRLIEPLPPRQAKRGAPHKTDLRAVINALRYMVRSVCEWRMLPDDFPPCQAVYYLFGDPVYDRRQLIDKATFLDFYGRHRTVSAGSARLCRVAKALCRRANLCLADPLPLAGTQLRAAH